MRKGNSLCNSNDKDAAVMERVRRDPLISRFLVAAAAAAAVVVVLVLVVDLC